MSHYLFVLLLIDPLLWLGEGRRKHSEQRAGGNTQAHSCTLPLGWLVRSSAVVVLQTWGGEKAWRTAHSTAAPVPAVTAPHADRRGLGEQETEQRVAPAT